MFNITTDQGVVSWDFRAAAFSLFNSIWPPCGQIILYLYNIICILLLLWYLQSNAKMQLSRKKIFWQRNAVSKIQERVKIRNWTNFPLFKTDIFCNSSIFIKISVIKRWNKSSSTRNSAKLSWAPSRTALNQAERCPESVESLWQRRNTIFLTCSQPRPSGISIYSNLKSTTSGIVNWLFNLHKLKLFSYYHWNLKCR